MALRRLVAGEPLIPALRADNFNSLVEGAERAKNLATEQPVIEPPRNPALIRIYNDTDVDLDSFAVVEIGEPYITDEDNLDSFQRMPCARGIVPTSEDSKVVILRVAAPADYISQAIGSGISPVLLQINNTSHGYAKPIVGDTTGLQTSDSGPWEILWRATQSSESSSSGSGFVWGWVRFVGQAGSAASGVTTEEREVVTDITCDGNGGMIVTKETIRVVV